MILNYNEWLNESNKFILPSKEDVKLTKLVTDILSVIKFTSEDLINKTKMYKQIRTEIDKEIDKKILKRIENKYNSFDRFLHDLLVEINPDLN